MKPSSVSTLKKELAILPAGDLIDICMKLAKFRKENKELLSYLLFDSNNEPDYINSVKSEINDQFDAINTSHIYFAKKSIRKILKITHKYIRYSDSKRTEVELLIFFCTKLKNSGIRIQSSTSLLNLYKNQVRKIQLAIHTLHEDLQHDYAEEIAVLNHLR